MRAGVRLPRTGAPSATKHGHSQVLAFENIEDATDIRRRLLLAFVVIGAGPTGVELAGAMVELARHAMPREFRRIDPAAARLVLLKAGPRVLPTFPEELGTLARTSLERMGVQVLTAAPRPADLSNRRA